jgi:nucleotide-binding universal stress UspA family protein
VDFDSNAEFSIRRLRELVPADQEMWFQPDFVVEFGATDKQILKVAAEHQADLIVVGVRALPSVSSMATHFGYSKAQLIVSHASCPVLTIRG